MIRNKDTCIICIILSGIHIILDSYHSALLRLCIFLFFIMREDESRYALTYSMKNVYVNIISKLNLKKIKKNHLIFSF